MQLGSIIPLGRVVTDEEAKAGGEAALSVGRSNSPFGYSGGSAFFAGVFSATVTALEYGSVNVPNYGTVTPPPATYGSATLTFVPAGRNDVMTYITAQRVTVELEASLQTVIAAAVALSQGNEGKARETALSLFGGQPITGVPKLQIAFAHLWSAIQEIARDPKVLQAVVENFRQPLTLSGSVLQDAAGNRYSAYASETNQKLTAAFVATGQPGVPGVTVSTPTEPGPGQAPGASEQAP